MFSDNQMAQYDRDGFVLVSGTDSGRDDCQRGGGDVVRPRYGPGRSGFVVSFAG